MRSQHRRVVLACCLLVSAAHVGAQGQWVKYVAPDKSFSLHHPQGWKVTQTDSVVQFVHAATGEEMALFLWNARPGAAARTLAEAFVPTLRQQAPDLQVSGWQGQGNAAACDVSYTEAGAPHAGLMLAMSGGKQGVIWLFTAPRAVFSRERALRLLQAVAASLAEGASSRPPPDAVPEEGPTAPALSASERARVETALRGYIFVLEFGLGGPFTIEQEEVILEAARRGTMVATAEGRAKLDGYPALVKAIMAIDQAHLEELRATIESTIRESLAESGDSDPAMQVLKRHLDARGRAIVNGNPPLTEMAAQSYAELYAFAEAAARNPNARLTDLDPAEIRTIRRQLVDAWPGFSQAQRQQVAGAPGLWMVLRKVIEFGSAAERQRTARQLAGIVTPPESSGGAEAEPSGTPRPMSMATHNSLMAIQQQTFNTYMWSRGFNYTPTGRGW